MPIKYNLTKNDILADMFHKLAQRKSADFSDDENQIRAMATIIASFSSGHSWQTYRCVIRRDLSSFNSDGARSEFEAAQESRWKGVTNRDILEVSQLNISDTVFFRWLSAHMGPMDRDKRQTYVLAWNRLQDEFRKDCDIRERQPEMRCLAT